MDGEDTARHLGVTLRNDGRSAGDGREERAAVAVRAARRIDGWIEDGIAEQRASSGLLHDYLGKLQLELADRASDPKLLPGNAAQTFVAAWGSAARNYAQTGNPYAPSAILEPRPENTANSALLRFAERFPDSDVDRLKQQIERGRLLREFADGSAGLGLVAIVETDQGSDGKLLRLELAQSSGSGPFDAHVLEIAPLAFAQMPPPPADLLRGRASLRAQWAFEGRISYWRKASELKLSEDGWYLAGLSLLSFAGVPVTGRNDLMGESMIPDFRNPKFVCSVRLVRLY